MIYRKSAVCAVAILIAFGCFNLAGGQVGQSRGLINPNIATEKELLALPHLNAALVKAILDHRPFSSMAEFNALLAKSLKKEQLAELYGRVFVQINLNSASDEEILMIPGVGPRMLREFKEYRPYTSMEQFRKEIGKYVDKEEVARLERYVTLN
jgi:DNA uptake protein ComE-like DNA-binding protein